MIGRALALALLVGVLLGGGQPAAAQLTQILGSPALTASPSASAAGPDQAIADIQASNSDSRIATRIRGIFAELPEFAQIRVEVRQGVVTLTGTVPQQADIARAENIAGRVTGVVTVSNGLSRDVSVKVGSETIGSLGQKLDSLVRLLPLVGVAILVAGIIIVLGYVIAGLTGFWRRVAPNSFLAELIASAIRFAFILAGLVIALDMIGAATLLGAVLGGAGVVGIALGFAMRDTIENYVASLMLSLRQPFRPNDLVEIDQYEGRVIRLTSRATILMTLDGNHLRIPNSQVFKAVILNYTRNPQRRFQFDMGIDLDDDALAARDLGVETLGGLPFVLDSPKPEGRIVQVGDSNILIRFLAWVDQRETDFSKGQSLAIVAVKVALEKHGFGLPEPIYRLRFDPRTTPLPFENIGKRPSERVADKVAAPAATGTSVEEAGERDVRPADEVAAMVAKERASDAGESDDLLDHARPVE